MSSQAAYFEAQTRLTRWTDELEFRGYILCELIDAESLNAIGFQCHQAADMPALINIIRPHTTEPSGNLTAIMSEDELKDFHQLMKKANQIRNKSAHHIIQSADKLKGLEDVKRRFSDMLDFSTRSIASDRGIHQGSSQHSNLNQRAHSRCKSMVTIRSESCDCNSNITRRCKAYIATNLYPNPSLYLIERVVKKIMEK